MGLLFSMATISCTIKPGANAGKPLSAEKGNTVANQAFIRTREVISYPPNSGYWNEMAPDVKHRHFIPYWSEPQLRRHMEMLKAFGFNSIQISITPQAANNAGVDQQEWVTRTRFLCRAARELGMSVSQFIWGTCVSNDQRGYRNLDWHKPEDRARLEEEYRRAAEFAPYVERVITHWNDPGGPACKDCTTDTVVEMHNAILAAFRAQNPRVRGALSTWFMRPGQLWPGYEGPGKLALHPKLDRDTDIALGLMNYGADGASPDFAAKLKVDDLQEIMAARRQAGVWGWYTTDVEILPSLHVHTGLLQNYFRNLPEQTRTMVSWHSLDDNCHGLNMQNLYVAGKLMQDPTLDAGKLLDEFARGFVGPSNAAALAAALRAVEQARTRSRRYEIEVEDPADRLHAEKKDRRTLPPVWLNETGLAVDAALRGLETVTLDPGFRTVWPVTMEPAEYLAELKAHLAAIRQMVSFLAGVDKIKRMKADGASAEELRQAVDALPQVTYDPAHTAGLEPAAYRQKLASVKKLVEQK